MTFFDIFMALIGIIDVVVGIFWLTCTLKPSVLRNEKIKSIYTFIIGYNVDELDLYE